MGKSLLLYWNNIITRLVHEVNLEFHKCLSSELELPSRYLHGHMVHVEASSLIFQKKKNSLHTMQIVQLKDQSLHTCIDLSPLIRR